MFNRFACFWPKDYQCGSLGKSHFLSSRRSGGSSLGFHAGSLGAKSTQTIGVEEYWFNSTGN